jgi:hypothetical protein
MGHSDGLYMQRNPSIATEHVRIVLYASERFLSAVLAPKSGARVP